MLKTIAIAKKSGKEFQVLRTLEDTVILLDKEGNEKEIKISTFKKGYATKEYETLGDIVSENLPEGVSVEFVGSEDEDAKLVDEVLSGKADMSTEEAKIISGLLTPEEKEKIAESQVQSNFCPETVESEEEVLGKDIETNDLALMLNASNAFEEVIFQIVKRENPNFTSDIAIPYKEKDAIRIRDNSRQAFKENEIRFKRAQSDAESVALRLEENKEDTFAKDELADLYKALSKYVLKMISYYTRYLDAKETIENVRADAELADSEGQVEEITEEITEE